MLSIGIRFGHGFDRMSTLKVLQSVPLDYDYDLLVIGTGPGGIACAREARSAGKKTAIIRWSTYTPAEKDGYDEDMKEMAVTLEIQDTSFLSVENLSKNESLTEDVFHKPVIRNGSIKSQPKSGPGISFESQVTAQGSANYRKKVRKSRLDLNNELFKRGKECVKMMQNAVALAGVVETACSSGWRLCTTRPPLSMNWHKMTEEIMDYVMKKNYDLMIDLNKEGVEIIEGLVTFSDSHAVTVTKYLEETTITADLICIAPSGNYEFPKDVEGSAEFGISFDDFARLSEPPGKTLIVGGTPEGLECAGILATCRFPVTIVTRKKILCGCDSEITQMIVHHLKNKGVELMENVSLKSIKLTQKNRLLATFEIFELEKENDNELKNENFKKTEVFDTVLFAVRKNINLEGMGLNAAEVERVPESGKIKANNVEATSAPNIYAVGDAVHGVPDCSEVAELAGKLLGRRLFFNEEQLMDYSFYPVVIYTPIEYAFVGISEDSALYRFGLYCVDVYHGFFLPLDFALLSIKEKCFAKVIVFKSTNQVIGMHIFGPKAGEIIQGFATGMKNGLTMKTLQATVGVPASNAQEFLKLKDLRTNEKEILTSSELVFGKVNHTN